MNYDENSLEKEFQGYSDLFLFAKVLNTFNPDMNDLSLALKSASTITDLIKKAANAADAIKNADLIEAIANLRLESAKLKSTLASAEERILEIEKENKRLREENTKLQEENNSEKLIFKNGLYYSQLGDGPFCTVCFDKNKLFIRVTALTGEYRCFGEYRCQNCNAVFGEPF